MKTCNTFILVSNFSSITRSIKKIIPLIYQYSRDGFQFIFPLILLLVGLDLGFLSHLRLWLRKTV